jgi:uncharacterized protein YndB with AHSA1/START domain
VAQYEFEVQIDAAPSLVWRALTDQLTSWWLPDFHVLGADSVVTLEPVPGGRLFEQNGTSGLLWYTVIAVSENQSLSLAGYCTPEWGGPCSTLLTIKLIDEGARTRVVISDALYGRVADKQLESLESGWRQMFDDGLRKFVEGC